MRCLPLVSAVAALVPWRDGCSLTLSSIELGGLIVPCQIASAESPVCEYSDVHYCIAQVQRPILHATEYNIKH